MKDSTEVVSLLNRLDFAFGAEMLALRLIQLELEHGEHEEHETRHLNATQKTRAHRPGGGDVGYHRHWHWV